MGKLIFYHGTTVDFRTVDLNHTSLKKDFGKGFYVTSSIDQACKWSVRLSKSRHCNISYIYSFMLHTDEYKKLQVLDTTQDEMFWLNIVYSNRIGKSVVSNVWDVIYGKVADANAQDIIDDLYDTMQEEDFYKIPEKDRKRTLKDLHTERLVDQYCFRTQTSIDMLNLRGYQRKEFLNGKLKK